MTPLYDVYENSVCNCVCLVLLLLLCTNFYRRIFVKRENNVIYEKVTSKFKKKISLQYSRFFVGTSTTICIYVVFEEEHKHFWYMGRETRTISDKVL